MQVSNAVIRGIPIDVMDDLSRLRPGDLPVLPLPAAPLRSVAQPHPPPRSRVTAVRLLDAWINRRFCRRHVRRRADHAVPASKVFSGREAVALLLVGVERIAVTVPHLVVALAHLAGCRWTLAKLTGPTYYGTSPSVFRRAMPLDALVMHEAVVVRCVLPFAPIDRAELVELRRGHSDSPVGVGDRSLTIARYKALGNSMAVPVMAWIGERIADVEAIAATGEAAA